MGAPQIPYNSRQKNNRGFHEEIALFLYPGLVQIEHNRVGRFVGIRDVRHEFRVDGIAPVRTSRIIEIDDIKFRLHFVILSVFK